MATVQLSRYQTGQTPRVRALEPAGCEERDLNNARASNSGIGHFWGVFIEILVLMGLSRGGGRSDDRSATRAAALTKEAGWWMAASCLFVVTQIEHRRLLLCFRAFRLGLPIAPVAKPEPDVTMICRWPKSCKFSPLASLGTRLQTLACCVSYIFL